MSEMLVPRVWSFGDKDDRFHGDISKHNISICPCIEYLFP